jgi:hypothetical protein
MAFVLVFPTLDRVVLAIDFQAIDRALGGSGFPKFPES